MIRHWIAAVALLPLSAPADEARPEDRSPLPATVEFNRDIRPILSENCYKCHGPDPKARQADLRVDTKDGIFAALEEGRRAVVPGSLSGSGLWTRVTASGKEKMPPAKSGKKLTEREVALLKRWIEQGAPWQGHWSFIPVRRPSPPEVRHPAWVKNPIDA